MSSSNRARIRRLIRGLCLPVVALAAYEAWFHFFPSSSTSLAPPSKVFPVLVHLLVDGEMWSATAQTVLGSVAGLALGGGIGLVLGVALGLSRIADRLLEVSIEVSRPVPPVALIPLALMVFGFGYRLEASIVALGAVWPVLLFTRDAIANVEPQLLEYATLLRMGFWHKVWRIVLPAIVPQLFVAFRLAAGISLVLAVTVEITINPLGLGSGIMRSSIAMNAPRMLAYLVWIGVVGVAINGSLLFVQRHLLRANPMGAGRV